MFEQPDTRTKLSCERHVVKTKTYTGLSKQAGSASHDVKRLQTVSWACNSHCLPMRQLHTKPQPIICLFEVTYAVNALHAIKLHNDALPSWAVGRIIEQEQDHHSASSQKQALGFQWHCGQVN